MACVPAKHFTYAGHRDLFVSVGCVSQTRCVSKCVWCKTTVGQGMRASFCWQFHKALLSEDVHRSVTVKPRIHNKLQTAFTMIFPTNYNNMLHQKITQISTNR